MEIANTYRLNFHPLDLEVEEVLDFQSFPVLTVEKNASGFKHVSYLLQFSPEGLEQRLVVPVTEERLNAMKAGKFSVREVFNQSELGHVFCLLYDESTGETIESWLLPIDYFTEINPISKEYRIANTLFS